MMKLRIEKSVTVLTPTIGSKKLYDCIESVQKQTYQNINHLIVADGAAAYEKIDGMFNDNLYQIVKTYDLSKITLSFVPYNTGGEGFYGHRIYAAYSHLVNTDYILFLDEDNWYEPDHVASLVEIMDRDELDFAFSLRKIYSPEKVFVAEDNCESLGLWPIYFTHQNPQYLVDTSSYIFTKDMLIRAGHLWHHGWGGDRRFFNIVRDKFVYDCTRRHTMCYRLDGNSNSVDDKFFINGNQYNLDYYKGELPWKTKT
jgi:glycosyltransferase involved in cell wall biosynthesis